MLEQANLLIDAGNTSIKYAWFLVGQDISVLEVRRVDSAELLDLVKQAKAVWLCSVSNDELNKQIEDVCKERQIAFTPLQSKASQFGLHNAYPTPLNMGNDRWLAMIAAHALQGSKASNFIVIDAGTAITVDFVVDNQHKGGWIAPGLSLARKAVTQHANKVFDNMQALDVLAPQNDTPQCLAAGALAQSVGMFEHANNLMRSYCDKWSVYISGGDAQVILDNCTQKAQDNERYVVNYIENLVLVGVAHIVTSNVSN